MNESLKPTRAALEAAPILKLWPAVSMPAMFNAPRRWAEGCHLEIGREDQGLLGVEPNNLAWQLLDTECSLYGPGRDGFQR